LLLLVGSRAQPPERHFGHTDSRLPTPSTPCLPQTEFGAGAAFVWFWKGYVQHGRTVWALSAF
jgi:hypothetical protein